MTFLDKPDAAAITNISLILRLFAHRNKNQHRRSIWWRHFNTFHHQTTALERELLAFTATPTSNLERVRVKAETPTIKAHIEQRINAWPVAVWQHAFSQLLADGQFAQLGLVLLACLAEVCNITQITQRLESLGEIEIQRVLNDFSRDWEDVGQAVARPVTPKQHNNAIDELFGGS